MIQMKNILLFLFCFPLSIMYAQPKFTVADVFTDNMVLQRDAKVRIWGKATNGEKIQLCLMDSINNASL